MSKTKARLSVILLAMSFVSLTTAAVFARPAYHAHHTRHHAAQQEESSEATPEGESTPPQDMQDGSQESQEQQQQESNQSESTEKEAATDPLSALLSADKDKSSVESLKRTFVIAEVIFFVMVWIFVLSGGSLTGGLLICAIVWHVGKLFRGGKKPAIG